MKKIYIVILNYNGFSDTKRCLDSLHILQDKNYKLYILLVDNGSRNKELINLKNYIKKFKDLRLIENKRNLGFAKGNNSAVKIALQNGADYILFLNNDTKIEMNFLRNLFKINAAISSPVIKFREFRNRGKFIYDLGGKVNWWTGRTTHFNLYKSEYAKFTNNKPISVDYVAGCCMLVVRDVFEKIGLFDEKYFMYFEDVDFCVTAKKHGFKVKVDPTSLIYHKLGGSIGRWSKMAIFHNLSSNFIFISKHLGLRRITGYSYLFILTIKIIIDFIKDNKT
uniref:Glycosyltransferase family 2 protein n=1 Tax=candidate division CPR3 bacterium TaxID=2268181 RepID=A0A7C4QXC5_UNCC3